MQDVGARRTTAGLVMVIALGREVEDRFPESGLVRAEGLAEFSEAPTVEFSLDALAVGILRGKEGTLRRRHVPQDIGEDFVRGLRQQRSRSHLGGFRAGQGRQGLVV